ncbi:MAG: hypothetical protein J0G30_05655 [Actinomycetales bacterium]|nr:hypothetical protein [Actinomycetales bacterium]
MSRSLMPRQVAWLIAAVFAVTFTTVGIIAVVARAGGPSAAAALVLYVALQAWVLVPGLREPLAPPIAAALAVGSTAVAVLSALGLPPDAADRSTVWYVSAVGGLLVAIAARGRPIAAWIGYLGLLAHTLVTLAPTPIATSGIVAVGVWIGAAQILMRTLDGAVRDSRRIEEAERAASGWVAAQEAVLLERRVRIAQTTLVAAPMLEIIAASGGRLEEAQREECLRLEAALRDEIRGRRLLDDGVREAVRAARARGVHVTLLDEGGIDDLDRIDLARVRSEISGALHVTDVDRIVVRTVASDSETAVTVVGLRRVEASGGDWDGEDDEVELWREIPRRLDG